MWKEVGVACSEELKERSPLCLILVTDARPLFDPCIKSFVELRRSLCCRPEQQLLSGISYLLQCQCAHDLDIRHCVCEIQPILLILFRPECRPLFDEWIVWQTQQFHPFLSSTGRTLTHARHGRPHVGVQQRLSVETETVHTKQILNGRMIGREGRRRHDGVSCSRMEKPVRRGNDIS